MTTFNPLDIERLANAPLPESITAPDEHEHEHAAVAAIFATIAKELSWRSYQMLRNGELVKPASHDDAMAMSETVYLILAAGFKEMLAEHYHD